MLKVTFHTGALDQANTFNLRAKLDIGYDQLDAVAAYKAELFRCGIGEGEPIRLGQYPRWSASVWDLVMRVAALGLWGREEFPEAPVARSGAYMTRMCVIVEHWADGLADRRERIATAEITMEYRRRCVYRCTLWDDMTGERTSELFRFAPKVIDPVELLARAVAWTDCSSLSMPPRPKLLGAKPFKDAGKSVIAVGALKQPARTGLRRWLEARGELSMVSEQAVSGVVLEETFARFMRSAV